jgi:hypothetical protein
MKNPKNALAKLTGMVALLAKKNLMKLHNWKFMILKSKASVGFKKRADDYKTLLPCYIDLKKYMLFGDAALKGLYPCSSRSLSLS